MLHLPKTNAEARDSEITTEDSEATIEDSEATVVYFEEETGENEG